MEGFGIESGVDIHSGKSAMKVRDSQIVKWVGMFSFGALVALGCREAVAMEIFAGGMEVPETISQIPSASGWTGGEWWNGNWWETHPDLSGDFLVPDPTPSDGLSSGRIWVMPQAGGTPESWLTVDFIPVGGVFVPWELYAEATIEYPPMFPEEPPMIDWIVVPISQAYVVAGWGEEGGTVPRMAVFQPEIDRFLSEFGSDSSVIELYVPEFLPPTLSSLLTTPVIAPPEFGSLGEALIVTDQDKGVWAYSKWSTSTNNLLFDAAAWESQTGTPMRPFGAVFAPEGFGSVGGTLLISGTSSQDDDKVSILSIASDGSASVFFEDLHLSPAQLEAEVGLRQMAFAPDGWGDLTGLLFLSVSGSPQGGGAIGQLLAIDGDGSVVKMLKVGTEFDKFDPRGLLFLEGGQLLISDASDPIMIATVEDFVVVPEPSALVLLAMGGLGFFVFGWRKRRQS